MKKILWTTCLITLCSLLGMSQQLMAQQSSMEYKHPLDPLDSNELKLVKQILLKEKKIQHDSSHYFSMVYLREPEKAEVKAWEPGSPIVREAFAALYHYSTNTLTEAIINLNDKKITSYETVENKQPVGHFKRDSIASDILAEDKSWLAALEKRGINVDSIEAHGNFAADMGIAPEGHREVIVSPYYKNKKYRRVPVGGLYAFVDLTDQKVLKIVDEGKGWNEPTDPGYFDGDELEPTLAPMKQVMISQPDGVNYELQGNQVITPHWKLRYGIHNREGLVIYDVQFFDPYKKEWRKIMYRGSAVEMVVNYGSPDLLNATNNYFDQGEFRFFQSKNRPLTAGSDAPENATYLDATVHGHHGEPVKIDSAVAIYEEYGGPLWRHEKHARRATDLSIKYYITAGNYDYGFKWIFKENGVIQVDNELQGIVHIRSVERPDDMPTHKEEMIDGSYPGVTVYPHVEANNHQHWHVFRLDMDVDGTHNTVAEVNNVSPAAGPENPYRNVIIAKPTMLKTEKQAIRNNDETTSRRWRVMTPGVRDSLGRMPSYVLMPSPGTTPLAHEGSSLSNRAKVLYNHFWVTPYERDEIYPAGMYPASNQKWEGLPQWTKQDRNIENTDVVLWYVMGKTHIVRSEDWPIMNRAYMSFQLVPFGFFEQNPALGVPPVSMPDGLTKKATPDKNLSGQKTPASGERE
ncbi:primary-amine oxidase [Catalinimonas alkaloidigena]|uniref:copper amine oxidase n=1 Tax=Catalinimonas alkaloidigena TaxID=1075417 RepID=UPI0024054116|nr:hypothetical protein [Catalinimonas alkaloidigena]MDF9801156.1 primary-amine oxidase [Catalinimonas alkaloidigena]